MYLVSADPVPRGTGPRLPHRLPPPLFAATRLGRPGAADPAVASVVLATRRSPGRLFAPRSRGASEVPLQAHRHARPPSPAGMGAPWLAPGAVPQLRCYSPRPPRVRSGLGILRSPQIATARWLPRRDPGASFPLPPAPARLRTGSGRVLQPGSSPSPSRHGGEGPPPLARAAPAMCVLSGPHEACRPAARDCRFCLASPVSQLSRNTS